MQISQSVTGVVRVARDTTCLLLSVDHLDASDVTEGKLGSSGEPGGSSANDENGDLPPPAGLARCWRGELHDFIGCIAHDWRGAGFETGSSAMGWQLPSLPPDRP
jgi:hypothetical protein